MTQPLLNRPRAPAAKKYSICTRCIMDTTDPDIRFDDSGVCNHCLVYDALVGQNVFSGAAGRERLAKVVADIKEAGAGAKYDCVIGVSGGVDSTFVAWKVKELGLRPLAVHLDNGWNSEAAVRNIQNALTTLKVDLYTEVLDWEEFKDIQLAFLRASTPDAETPSDHAIFATVYRVARKMGVRNVILGTNIRTETHLPSAWSHGHRDWGYLKAVQRQFGTRRIKTFPHFPFYQFATTYRHGIRAVDILNYMDYSKKEAMKILPDAVGWKDYGGKHHESVYTRWFQGYYLPTKFGFDKRKTHLSSQICSGEVPREAALRELENPPYPPSLQAQDCEYVAKKLGISKQEFDEIMAMPPRRFEDFPSYEKFCRARWMHGVRRVYQFFKYTLGRRPK